MNKKNFGRREFIKVAGLTGSLAFVTAVGGVKMLNSASGQPAPDLSPYENNVDVDVETPGPHILVVEGLPAGNPFSIYLEEILITEGFNGFHRAEASAITIESLAQYNLVLLTHSTVDEVQANILFDFVSMGGKLIVMRPESVIRDLLGMGKLEGGLSNGYVFIDESYLKWEDVFEDSLQFHGGADLYQVDSWETIAWLTENPESSTRYPAVMSRSIGEGKVIAWAYDLAVSVVLTRQGNPDWADQDRDGREGIRAVDSFVGWIDLDRIAVPQADVQMRFLSRQMTDLLQDMYPLPRIWYFPDGARTILIATGDSHENPAWAINEVFEIVEKYGGTMTIYYTPPPSASLLKRAIRKTRLWLYQLPLVGDALGKNYYHVTPTQVKNWQARGHEFALHPYVDDGLEAGWEQYWQEFTGLGFVPVSPTVRTHKILWSGWVESARVQATYGIRLNLDYYHYGPAMQKENGEWVYGYFTGSGLAMKFIDEEGKILNISQQLTQLVDEHLIKMPWGLGGSNVGGQEGAEVAKAMLEQSLSKYPAAICGQFHADPIALGGEIAEEEKRFMEGTLNYAQAHGIPIISASKWLEFLDFRCNSIITDVKLYEEEKTLEISVNSPEGGAWKPPLLIPETWSGYIAETVDLNGIQTDPERFSLAGINYLFLNLPAGLVKVKIKFTEIIKPG
jgi:hypothetical protein